MIQPPGSLRARALPWIAASLPFVFLVVWFWNRGPGLDADDYGLYLMHAEALLDGRAYSDTRYVATPLDIAPSVQPPGLPLVLAATMSIAGGFHWTAVKLAMAATALPFFLIAGLYFARDHGRQVGIAVALMLTVALAAHPPAGATHIQPDLGFAGLVWAAIFLLDKPGHIGWTRAGAVLLLTALAISYRLLGLALLPAIGLFAITNRGRGGLKLAMPLALGAVAAIVYVSLSTRGWDFFVRQIPRDTMVIVRRAIAGVQFYGTPAAEAHLYPLPWNLGNDVFHVMSLSLAVLGIAAWSRVGWRSSAWLFMVSYLLLLGVVTARSGRYLIPLYPILIFGFLHGIRVTASIRRLGRGQSFANRLASSTGMVVASSALVLLVVREPRDGGSLPELPEAQSLFAYLADQQQSADTRVAFTQARVLSWYTGIPAMVVVGTPPHMTMPELERLDITHVVLDRLGLETDRTSQMRATIAANSCRFHLTFDNGAFEVHRVLPSCSDPTPS